MTLRQVTSPPSSGASVHSQYSPEKPSSQTQENESTPSEQRPPLKHLDKGWIERKLRSAQNVQKPWVWKNLPLSFRPADGANVEFSRDVKCRKWNKLFQITQKFRLWLTLGMAVGSSRCTWTRSAVRGSRGRSSSGGCRPQRNTKHRSDTGSSRTAQAEKFETNRFQLHEKLMHLQTNSCQTSVVITRTHLLREKGSQ